MTSNGHHSGTPKRVLITGGAGFIGSHVAEALFEQGHHVTVLDDLSTGCLDNIRHLLRHQAMHNGRSRFHFLHDCITNETVLDQVVGECDVVFHLAAAVGVKLVVENPVHTIETNVMGTETVLRAALRHGTKVLLTSTSEVYGKGNCIPFREDDDVILGPTYRSRWGYAATKMMDEFLALAYHREKGLPVVICRLFNVVGPRQTGRYGMVMPRFAQQALRGDALTVYGDGQQTRCFLHVQDAVRALLALAQCPGAEGEVFNIGSTEEVSILDLARHVLHAVDVANAGDDRLRFIPYEQAYATGFEDMRRRVPDITKIHTHTGWEPQYTLHEILWSVITSITAQEFATLL